MIAAGVRWLGMHVPAITISLSLSTLPLVPLSPADSALVSWLITTDTAETGHRGQPTPLRPAKNIQTHFTVIRESVKCI